MFLFVLDNVFMVSFVWKIDCKGLGYSGECKFVVLSWKDVDKSDGEDDDEDDEENFLWSGVLFFFKSKKKV